MHNHLTKTGTISSVFALISALTYAVSQVLAEFTELLPAPGGLYWLFIPSLLLAPMYVVVMISLHYTAIESRKFFTAIAIAFAIIYAVLVIIVYFTQVSYIIPGLQTGAVAKDNLLVFEGNKFMVAIDCAGYVMMSVSSLFAAFAFKRLDGKLYAWLLFHGLMAPVVLLAFFFPVFFYIGALWIISFPGSMVYSIKHFHNHAKFDV